MSSAWSELDGLDPRLRPWAARLLSAARLPLEITSVHRSLARQRRLYRRFLSGRTCCNVNPPGLSQHEHGLAWDMTSSDAELERLGAIWRSWGGLWGGEADPIHFEATASLLQRSSPSESS